jgi:AAA+ superfamily predicted ATPase
MRSGGNDVGEARRILNSFLQYTDRDDSTSLVLAATNHAEILDYALFRRFDDVIEYPLPDKEQRTILLKSRLEKYVPNRQSWLKISELADGLSLAELARTAEDIVKNAIIIGRDRVNATEIIQSINERKKYHEKILKQYTKK